MTNLDNNIPSELRLFTVEDVCNILHVGRTKLYELINQDLLKPVKQGKLTMFLYEDIRSYINSLKKYGE